MYRISGHHIQRQDMGGEYLLTISLKPGLTWIGQRRRLSLRTRSQRPSEAFVVRSQTPERRYAIPERRPRRKLTFGQAKKLASAPPAALSTLAE
jgi:hypothetical protein